MNALTYHDEPYRISYIKTKYIFSWLTVTICMTTISNFIINPGIGIVYLCVMVILFKIIPKDHRYEHYPSNWGNVCVFNISSLSYSGLAILDHPEFITHLASNGINGYFSRYDTLIIPEKHRSVFTMIYLSDIPQI